MTIALYVVAAIVVLALGLWFGVPVVLSWRRWWTAIAAHAGRTAQRCAWCLYVDRESKVERPEDAPFGARTCTRHGRWVGPFDHCAQHICVQPCEFCEVRKANA